MSIIVLEGPDGGGKSTIARHFTDPSVVQLKQGPPPVSQNEIMAHYLKPIEAMIGQADKTFVMDRWHLGELIYGPLLRGKSMLTTQQADYIDMVLQTFGANFFYVMVNDPIVLQERCDIRGGDDLIKREWLPEILHDYDQVMQERPHWAWTSSTTFPYGVRPRMHSRMAGPYIGPERPDVLLLGDRRADNRMIFPFVPERATSGHWLMGALFAAEVDHMRVGILNACEVNTDSLYTQWQALHEPPVVVMGRNAEKAWKATGRMPTRYVNHPQYERRFHFFDGARYGQKIKDVMR